MKRTVALFLLTAILLSVFIVPASAASSWVSVYIDGEKYDGITQVKNNTTYVGIRKFATDMDKDAKVTYTSYNRTLTVKTDSLTLICRDGENYIEANGRYIYTETPLYMSNGRMYAPVIILAKAFGAKINWHDHLRGFTVTRGTGAIEGRSYREDEVFWLARIIQAESGGEPFTGKIAVGNVILNRVRSKSYPNTIYGVIFDKRYGVQFSPVSNGTIYNTPSEESIAAAKICLDGYSISTEIIYFVNPKVVSNSWASKNRPYFGTIGNHAFYC
ncbi:MAG: cell wall hydrolase [Clostridia bacterium]|nr:cell wall hydrolase [Clostridia bacterium]